MSLTGTRLVEAALCQPAETYQRAATERRRRRLFTLHYCTAVAVSATTDTARLSRYRCLPFGAACSVFSYHVLLRRNCSKTEQYSWIHTHRVRIAGEGRGVVGRVERPQRIFGPSQSTSWPIDFFTDLPDLSCMTMMKIAFYESVNRVSKCTKCGQLILRKGIKIVATRCHILQLKCTKFDFGHTP